MPIFLKMQASPSPGQILLLSMIIYPIKLHWAKRAANYIHRPARGSRLASMQISQHFTCSFETVFTMDRNHIGLNGIAADNDAAVLSEDAIEKRAGQLFREQWDIIWLDFNFSELSEGFKLTILDRIEKGAGLIYVGDKSEISSIVTERRIDDTPLKSVTFGKFFPECLGKRKKGIVTVFPKVPKTGKSDDIDDYSYCAVNTIIFFLPTKFRSNRNGSSRIGAVD